MSQSGPDLRNGREIYRGSAVATIVPPAWVGYMQIFYLDTVAGPPTDFIEVQHPGGEIWLNWYYGQLLPINNGCGNGYTFLLNKANAEVSIWGYPATAKGRTEGFELAVRDL